MPGPEQDERCTGVIVGEVLGHSKLRRELSPRQITPERPVVDEHRHAKEGHRRKEDPEPQLEQPLDPFVVRDNRQAEGDEQDRVS